MKLDLSNAKPEVVVNSIITPDSAVVVSVGWSKSVADTGMFKKIEGAQVELSEDGIVVFSGTTDQRGVARSTYHPQAGRAYQLRVVTSGRELTASTSIPENSTLQFIRRQKDHTNSNSSWYRFFVLADISSITPQPDCRSLYLTISSAYDNGMSMNSKGLFTNSMYVDQMNGIFETNDNNLTESNRTYQYGFVRIPKRSFGDIAPLTIASEARPEDSYAYYKGDGSLNEHGYPMVEYIDLVLSGMYLDLITPSDDYDLFCRSVCKQILLDVTSFPFVPGGEPIYSNVKNGMGLFAGYNSNKYDLGIEIPQDEEEGEHGGF